MSSIHPTKRRRIDDASHTLSQPFKSPFKTPLKPKTDTQTNASPSPTKDDNPSKDKPREDPSQPSVHNHPSTTPLRPPHPRPPPSTPQSSEYTTLQKRHTHLLNTLATARSHLETSTQALKIESSNRETELHSLIQKWKGVSRAAAEDVFAKARDRVNRMGGVGALRERERQSKDRGWGWDEEEGRKEGVGEEQGGEGDGEGEGKGRDEREEEEVVAGDDEEGYTMDMMLKALNIELDVIGYDKGAQKWID